MTHRSRAYAVLIDTPREDAPAAAAFWSAALGAPAHGVPGEEQFTVLGEDALPGLVVAVQAVDDATRFHVDVETDDVEAETARLVGLRTPATPPLPGPPTPRPPKRSPAPTPPLSRRRPPRGAGAVTRPYAPPHRPR